MLQQLEVNGVLCLIVHKGLWVVHLVVIHPLVDIRCEKLGYVQCDKVLQQIEGLNRFL